VVAKVTVSLTEELLAALDAEAEARGASRSAVVAEALEELLGARTRARAGEERRQRISGAVDGMREMAARNPALDGRLPLEALREVRASGGSARGRKDGAR
jgi:metal-responsive CopG/Arc/MetJ family transcriptional regulator